MKRGVIMLEVVATDRILPCPHCGSSATLNCNYSYKTRTYFVYVKCDLCGSQGKIYNSSEDPNDVNWNNQSCIDSIKAWNMRFDYRNRGNNG